MTAQVRSARTVADHQYRVGDRPQQRVAALAEADAKHDKHQANKHGRGRSAPTEPKVACDSTGTVAHQITAERRRQQIAETGRERKIALVHRDDLSREKLAEHCSRHDDGVGEGERDPGKYGEFGAI